MSGFVEALREKFGDALDRLAFTSLHRRVLLVLFAVVLIASVLVVSRGHSAPVLEPLPVITTAPKVIVDVAGAVKKPGVYELPADARVTDAIAAAGGALPGADTSEVNLARIIKDGEQIYLEPPTKPEARVQPRTPHLVKKSGPININRANASELDSLPGIGPVLAARIVAYRKANGPFLSVDDLQKVSGIGAAKFAQFKNKIRA